MEFLKNHYEKIILAIFLVSFVLALVYAIQMIATAGQTTREALEIPKKDPDYQPIDFKANKFKPATFVGTTGVIEKRVKRNERDVVFTQLDVPFEISRCPHCGLFIPRHYFMSNPHKCPLCTGSLPEPKVVVETTLDDVDTDEDGISDKVEKQYGLNPNDPNDAGKDQDGDGFPNLFEATAKPPTALNDPKSHPPLCFRLYVYRIARTVLGVKLKKLQDRGDNRSEWDIQLDIGFGKRARTKFCKLNEVIKVGNTDYKIIDCNKKQEEIFDEKTKSTVIKDKSEVVIQSVNGEDKVVMVADQPVYSPRETVLLRDVTDEKTYRLELDSVFQIGDERTGVEKYKLIQVDSGQKVVQLKSETDNKIYEVSEKKRFELDAPGNAEGGELNPAVQTPKPKRTTSTSNRRRR